MALGLFGAHGREPLGGVAEDARNLRDGLDVVDNRGTGVQTGDRGERGLEARVASTTLEGVQQGRLLTADVGASTRVGGNAQVAEHAGLGRLAHGL